MNYLQEGDWIRNKILPNTEAGKVFWVGEDRCAATFFTEPNDDGSPSFADDHDVKIDEMEVITDPAEIKYLDAMMKKERKLQDLWPEWGGESKEKVLEILLKAEDLELSYLDILDEAIQYLIRKGE